VPAETPTAGGAVPYGGEFLEITFSDGNDPIFVHYSQVYQPTDLARREMSLLAVLLGVLYQNSRAQIAKLEDIITEAEAINVQIAKLISLYHLFNAMQTQFGPDELHGKVMVLKWDVLEEFQKADLPLPFAMGTVGAFPFLYYGIGCSNYLGLYWNTKHRIWSPYGQRDSVDVCELKDDYFTYTYDTDIYSAYNDGKTLDGVEMDENGEIYMTYDRAHTYLMSGSYPYNLTTPAGIEACMADGMESSSVTFEIPDSGIGPTASMALYCLLPKRDENGAFTRLYFVERYYAVDISASTTSGPVGCFPFLKTAQAIEDEKSGVYASCDDLKAYCDFIRSKNDIYSSWLSNISSMISLETNELMQDISAASSIVQKFANTQRRTASNVH
ncbi:MAG: hypothetical protein LBB14_00355, partial [Puniceicoccales bacterium]|jgi:hypothetical protein|nr:hypothetical protein [Puniceicoccales bacterium]